MQDTPHNPGNLLRYRLTAGDALAFTMLGRKPTFLEKLRLMVVIGIGGLVAGALPRDMPAAWWWACIAAILIVVAGISLAWSNLLVRREARQLPLAEGPVELVRRRGGLVERSASGERVVTFANIRQVVATAGHVFIRTGGDPLIVPASAFGDADEMNAFAAHLDQAAQAARSECGA